MLVVSTLFAWLALASLCEAGYVREIFSQDGWGAANPFLYPQMTAAVDAVTYAIYHYSVNGVDGNAGISLITESGMLYRNFPIIMPSQTNPPVNPPYNFINDSFVGQFPYHAEYMYGYYNATTNQHLIEMIIPVEIPISGGHQMQMVGMIIDYFGHYVGPLTTPSLQVSVPYQVSGQPMSQLTVTHNPSSRTIVVGGVNQPFMQTINLTQYWHHADGCITLAADIKVLNPTDPANAALVVLLDNSQQAYPSVDQVILIINPYTGVLLDKIDTGIYYDVNSLVTYGRRQVTLTPDNRIMVVPPSTYQQRSVYRWTQSSAWGALTVPNGYVEKVWFTNLGYLQGQAVLSDSTVVTTRISETDTTAQTTAVVITNPATQQVISQFSTITGLTPAAIAAGAVANINGYMIVAISADANDNLYLSNYWQNGYNTGRAPGVLVVSKTGQFIDWYTGFQLPQTVSFDRQGHMLVPDRFGDVVYVINTTSHTTVSTPSCPGCLGVAIDSVNGGYVATTSVYWQNTAAIRFMDSSFAFVSALGTIPFSFNSFGDQAALSNPVVDSQGRIYVLVSQYAGLTRSSAVLKVYNPSTRALILQHGFANAQPRGYPGISQLRYGLSLSIDQNSQAIVASTINFGQIFKTKPL